MTGTFLVACALGLLAGVASGKGKAPKPVKLAARPGFIVDALATDDTHIVWLTDGALYEVSRAGGWSSVAAW